MGYIAPIDDLKFALRVHGQIDKTLSQGEEAFLDIETVDAILEEAGKFAQGIWAESNQKGDVNGAKLIDGKVLSDESFAQAFQDFREAGWVSLHTPSDYGGQGLPAPIAVACEEMWYAGNLSLSLLPMLTNGAIAAIYRHASETLKQKFLPKMIEGIWSGTMNLTEPQAGTDLAKILTKAVPNGDHYQISGQKIFITWGDQELTENIIHLVLARLPNAEQGTKGISLFIVPKFKINDDDSLGVRNTVSTISLEHKLGIHGSPTCVMQYDEAEGYLVGEEGKGLNYMFTMMNAARLGVGIEGVAVSERAFQHARSYAHERVQSREYGSLAKESVSIIHHPDVRRMLLVQKATVEAERALYLAVAFYLEQSQSEVDQERRVQAQAVVDFMIPIIKGFCTENSITLTNLALQVFGGMGFIEETGAAQYVRDARITTIYEGTTGIQALDFVGRKTAMNGGLVGKAILKQSQQVLNKLQQYDAVLADELHQALEVANEAIDYIIEQTSNKQFAQTATGSYAYLMLMSTVLTAVEFSKAYLAATEALQSGDALLSEQFYRNKIDTVKVYFSYILPNILTYRQQLHHSADSILNIHIDQI